MKFILNALVLALIVLQSHSQNNELITFFEKSNYLETPKYDNTIEFCKLLCTKSKCVNLVFFGTSPEDRMLPLLIVDKDNLTDPKKIKENGKVILLIQACIHAGEPDGKDAGLMLLRDIISKPEMSNLLNNVTILFIPIFNVDGHERFGAFNRINQNGPKEMGWRTNANNLNLNRDYIKAEAPETKAWLKLFNNWQPDFFIDCHVTDGADYIYPLTYALEINGNMDSSITRWQRNIYLPFVKSKMEKIGSPIFQYVSFRDWHNIESGIESWVTPPMLSQGYTAINNCPGLLIETHMLKDYKTRVFATYNMLKFTIELLNLYNKDLLKLRAESNKFATSEEFRKKIFPLSFNYSNDSIIIDFKGKEYTSEKSDLSGGIWYKFGENFKDYKIPLFNKLHVTDSASLPKYYIIPRQYNYFEEILKNHNIYYNILQKDTEITVCTYQFKEIILSQNSSEGHQKVQSFNYDTTSFKTKLMHGAIVIPVNQQKSKVIAHLFEPGSPASLFQYGYFNSTFEQKEYGESYVLEPLAREMLKDKTVKEKFEKEVINNPKFPKDSYLILNWFYTHSQYKDNQQNIYPIYKVFKGML